MGQKKLTGVEWVMLGLALYGLAVNLATLLCDIPRLWQISGLLAVTFAMILLLIRSRKNKKNR